MSSPSKQLAVKNVRSSDKNVQLATKRTPIRDLSTQSAPKKAYTGAPLPVEPANSLIPHVKMHAGQMLPRLFVAKTPDRGKGVFTMDAIEDGSLVEVAHVITFSEDEWKSMAHTNAYNYVYEWPEHARGAALACGYGSHFNHSADSHNLTHTNNYVDEFISYFAIRDIAPGEELLIDYGCEWWHDGDRGQKESDSPSRSTASSAASAARP